MGVRSAVGVTMDDATSEVYSAFFVAEEGTMSTFQALREVVGERGLFCSFYTDRRTFGQKFPLTCSGRAKSDVKDFLGRRYDRQDERLTFGLMTEAFVGYVSP